MSIKRILRGERGQGLVEMAMVMPLLLLLALGTADLGLAFRTYIALTNAAREGARWVSTHPENPAGAMARVTEEAGRIGLSPDAVDDSLIMVTFTPNKASYTAGENVTVSVAHDYQLLFGIVTAIPEISFETSATMTVLYEE
jgi:Flp pilus assembly protein TadG